ncbi:hypothetical protein PITC_087400 [Penicillium italicum]|uniref:Uncharacterized protein n=1 Tax=Penicillium italicum TaxID=40296 RepID=A0A0A2K8N6_PENIT|nr:hypothetical protein PITC_087400 [Penicillium italicum]
MPPESAAAASPVPAERNWCIHYLRTSLWDWDAAEWTQPFKMNCIRDAVTPESCQRFNHIHKQCEPVSTLIPEGFSFVQACVILAWNAFLQLYEGIQSHCFESHALLEWVLMFWINEKSFGQTDDAGLLHEMEKFWIVAIAVQDLCFAFDGLINAHGKAQTLVGKHGGSTGSRKAKPRTLSIALLSVSSCKSLLHLSTVVMLLGIKGASNSGIVRASIFV